MTAPTTHCAASCSTPATMAALASSISASPSASSSLALGGMVIERNGGLHAGGPYGAEWSDPWS